MTDAAAPELHRFRAAVMADPAIQQRLCQPYDPAEFEEIALAWAAERGIGITRDDLRTRPDPLGVRQFAATPLSGNQWPPLGFLPARFAPEANAIDWLHFGGAPLTESFYSDSLTGARFRPFNRLFGYRTPLPAFTSSAQNGLAPDGFVFHMSRCGSTLVAQMLAASPANISVSEPPPLDAILQLPLFYPGRTPEAQIASLQAMVSALGRNQTGAARRYFIKADSWHTLALPLFRQAFPDTPWVFLYRDPVEVLVSQMRMRGMQTTPGAIPPTWFGFTPEDANLPDADYAARVLARTCAAVIDNWHLGGGMLVEYSELPDAFFSRILPHFGVTPDAAETRKMRAASRRNAKAPDSRFQRDSEEKRREADPKIHAAAEQHLAGVYAKLQSIRVSAPR
jgi:hypothetical protein